jgi:hypothetical protein
VKKVISPAQAGPEAKDKNNEGPDSIHGPRNPGSREQRETMAKLGVPDFETVQQCRERQQQMARQFERAGELQHDAEWQECEPKFCAATPCRDGCWHASRDLRFQMVTETEIRQASVRLSDEARSKE